ncbi:hypothetical protein BG015_009244 [Linnemannia schmuckeri]|uniref:Uncharacterized protein n=1 Tax=Linnemannia schmuckeri TaxID=64567 RepID=A0A9P5RW68_9FUNG|nr:hypothetical protein BG015_009244 [Linnemannia schmuckeri]
MTNTDFDAEADTHFQAFCAPGEQGHILIPVVWHPTLNQLYVLWTDITDCFPGVTRIQYGNIFVPMLRNERLYRVEDEQVAVRETVDQDADTDDRNENDDNDDGSSEEGERLIRVEMQTQQQQKVETTEFESATPKDIRQIVATSVFDLPFTQEEKDLRTGQEEAMDTRDINDLSEEEWAEIAARVMEMEREEHEQRGKEDGEDDDVVGSPPTQPIALAEPVGPMVQEKALMLVELVKHRAKEILKKQYDEFTATIESTKPTIATISEPQLRANTNFQLYNLCDCGGILGFDGAWYPHWIKDDELFPTPAFETSYSPSDLGEVIPIAGEYMMGVLEMLKYGVCADGVTKIPTQTSPDLQKRLSLAISYLESRGVLSCERYLENVSADLNTAMYNSMLDGLPPIATLDWHSCNRFQTWTFDRKEPQRYPCRTSEGYDRRVCRDHLLSLLPQSTLEEAGRFSADPSSVSSYAVGFHLENQKHAANARVLPDGIPDFDNMLSVTVVQLTVPIGTGTQRGAVSGWADGFELLIVAALRNSKVDKFVIFKRPLDSNREFIPSTNAINTALQTLSFDEVTITLAESGAGTPGCDIEDADFASGDLLSFFVRRQWCDEFSCWPLISLNTAISQLGCLTNVRTGFSPFSVVEKEIKEKDGIKVEDLIKRNRGLKSLELDDFLTRTRAIFMGPSRLSYSSIQGLSRSSSPSSTTVTTLTILHSRQAQFSFGKTCEIRPRYGWRFPAMEKTAFIRCSNPDEATALEKSIRSKKGPLALKRISIIDISLLELSVRESLQSIILQRNIEEIVVEERLYPDDDRLGLKNQLSYPVSDGNGGMVHQDYETTAAEIWADFLVAVRSKVTEVVVKNDPRNRVLKAIGSRTQGTLDMPWLQSLKFKSVMDSNISLFSGVVLRRSFDRSRRWPCGECHPRECSNRHQHQRQQQSQTRLAMAGSRKRQRTFQHTASEVRK